MKVLEVNYPTLTEESTTNPAWDKTLYFGGKVFSKWIYSWGVKAGTGIIINGKDGVFIGTIEDHGDPEFGQNWLTVELM